MEATAPIIFPKSSSSLEAESDPNPATASTAPFAFTPPRGTEPMHRLPSVPPMRRKIDTLRPPLTAGAAPPPPEGHIEGQPVVSPSVRPGVDPMRPAATGAIAGPPWQNEPQYAGAEGMGGRAFASAENAGALPPPTRPVRRAQPDEEAEVFRQPPPSSYDDPYSTPRRGRVGGWVVALTLLLAVGVVGWAVAKPYLVAARETTSTAQLDPRAQAFLIQGEGAMADGNLDVAQENFDKASALAEHDARVLLDEARLGAAKADVPWLKLRLVTPDAVDEIRTTKAQLDDLVVRARRLADDARAAAPQDPAAARASVDALRLSGDRDAARAEVGKIGGSTAQGETAYVLAALDLAEPAPLWATAIERLRSAAAVEGNAGRARAALIYALAKSGDVAGARTEIAKLDALARPYPLLPNLRAFVDKAAPAAAASSSAVAATGTTRGVPVVKPPAGGAPAPAAPAADVPSDPRLAMQAAGTAMKKGDFSRARAIYQGIVDRNPNDSEAVAGLGDVARVQNDPAGAISAYKRAIAINPSYLPALLGVADTEWSGGDRATAAKAYGDIVDRFPEGTYPAYVTQRAEGGGPAKAAPNGTPTEAPASTDESTP
jgi:tetratricopeptide (TPR) repeat protein